MTGSLKKKRGRKDGRNEDRKERKKEGKRERKSERKRMKERKKYLCDLAHEKIFHLTNFKKASSVNHICFLEREKKKKS